MRCVRHVLPPSAGIRSHSGRRWSFRSFSAGSFPVRERLHREGPLLRSRSQPPRIQGQLHLGCSRPIRSRLEFDPEKQNPCTRRLRPDGRPVSITLTSTLSGQEQLHRRMRNSNSFTLCLTPATPTLRTLISVPPHPRINTFHEAHARTALAIALLCLRGKIAPPLRGPCLDRIVHGRSSGKSRHRTTALPPTASRIPSQE